jgi:hypothetical protein
VKFRGGGVLKGGTLIGRIHAVDLDKGPDGIIRYLILPQATQEDEMQRLSADDFLLDPEAGEIRTTSDIFFPSAKNSSVGIQDKERQLQLIAEAVDSSELFPRKSRTVILIKYPGEARSLRTTVAEDSVIEFIPLPKTVFIALGKPVHSTILK